MNTTLIKLLLLIKNAAILNKETITCSYNKLYIDILKILYKEGFILYFKIINDNSKSANKILIGLKYSFGKTSFNNIKFISVPSKTIYLTYKNLCKISDKKFTLFLSTNKGLFTLSKCKSLKLGGTALFVC